MRLKKALVYSFFAGCLLLNAGCTSQADELINQQNTVLANDPNNVNALILRAQGFKDKREPQNALADLNRAIELSPDSARALTLRGAVHMDTMNYEAAIQDFDRAIENNPDASEAFALRGQSRVEAKQNYQLALEDLDTALEKGERTAQVHRYRGLALVRLSRRDEARQAYDEALKILEAPPAEGQERIQGRQMVEIASEALTQSGASARLYLVRGQGYQLQNNHREAIDDFTAALREDSRSMLAFQKRADSHHATGNCDAAIADLQSACRLGNGGLCESITLDCEADDRPNANSTSTNSEVEADIDEIKS